MSERQAEIAVCNFFGSSASSTESFSYSAIARRAAYTLTKDGLILEKLHALIARLSTGSDRSKEIAEELKAIVGDAR